MTRGIHDNNNTPADGFARQVVQGWYTGSNPVNTPSGPSSNVDLPGNNTLAFLGDDKTYLLVSNGSTYESRSGIAVCVSGKPAFREASLAAVAREAGPAAAVAAGYETYAHDIFSQLFGPFCCAIIDARSDRVLLGIDRLGQHSLYYRVNGREIGFGNSASGALSPGGGDNTLPAQGVYNYVYFHMVPSPGTAYRGMGKLPAAHYLDFHNGQLRVENYWQPSFSEETKTSFQDLSGQLMQSLRGAVENCLPHGGKIGSFLSGGLDSSTVTGLLSEITERQAEAYSIGFSAEGYDEMAFARITARHFGVKLNEYYVTPQDVVDALPLVATSYDEPFGNSSALPAYFCARMAAEANVDTLFAGDGGDELFAGNERYVRQRAFQRYETIPVFLRTGLLEPAIKLLPGALPLAAKAKSYIAQAVIPLPDRLQSYNFLHRHSASEIFQDSFLADVDIEEPLKLLRSTYHRPANASELNRMLYLDWQFTLADNDLRKVSHMCDLAGVDVVYPMLDDALVEFSALVPSAWKIKGSDLRHFYKRATEGWLPDETIHKSKQGFGLPFGVWMKTYKPLQELAYDNLLSLKDRGFVRPEFIDKTIDMHRSEHAAYYGELVWIFTVFELWLRGREQQITTA